MASFSPITCAAALCLVAGLVVTVSADMAASSVPAPAAAPSSVSVEDTCKVAGAQVELCVEALTSSPAVRTTPTDTRGLARAAVLLAKENATAMASHLSRIYDSDDLKNSTGEIIQCLEDCEERYQAAVSYLGDATTAMDAGSFEEAGMLIGGAQAEVKLCQKGCKAVRQGEHRNVLTVRNRNVDRLCSVATAITRLLHRRHQ